MIIHDNTRYIPIYLLCTFHCTTFSLAASLSTGNNLLGLISTIGMVSIDEPAAGVSALCPALKHARAVPVTHSHSM